MNCTVRFELDNPVTLGKKGKIIALSHKKSGAETAPALANDNAPRSHELAAVGLDAKPLRIGITAVRRTSLCFCMRHVNL